MTYKYHDPGAVISPKKFIRKVTVLYDGGANGFSLAVINWDGLDHIGIRWNVAIKERESTEKQCGQVICHGSPSLRGVPSWFILPRELFDPVLLSRDSRAFLELVAKWVDNRKEG